MAQQIISMAKEETSQDILTRVRGLESTNSVIAQSTNTINNAITSSSKGVFGLCYAEGKVAVGDNYIAFELPEDGVERYLLSCYVGGGVNGRHTGASAKVVIDGEKWGEAIITSSGDSLSNYTASVNIANRSELAGTAVPGKDWTTNYAIGDSVSGHSGGVQMVLYLYGKIPFHSLQLISSSKRVDVSWSCLYYERLK